MDAGCSGTNTSNAQVDGGPRECVGAGEMTDLGLGATVGGDSGGS